MKRLGLRPVRFASKTDGHYKKDGLVNWWETINAGNKNTEKRSVLKEIKEELSHYIQDVS